ncbi:MAG: acyl-CoA dehydrogenase family protein [Actinobacteria bacterium]|nr:acyl-CoA dehydrogenase family protein [Actinomycetota bacterium]
MVLFHPHTTRTAYPDERTSEVMRSLVEFFEAKGLARVKEDDRAAVWYQDFLDFVAEHRLFATMCTPAAYGGPDTRWDTWRNCEFGEILGFYGLPYWYTWQVSVLGLGPIWMSGNEAVKQEAAGLLDDGAVFAYGLSERQHGADLYSSEMTLTPLEDGGYRADGSKYYIGNANAAAIVSTFGKMADTGEWVFFAVHPDRPGGYTCVQNVVHSQNYVGEYRLDGYRVEEGDILARGDEAWDAALNTVNVGKFNLGWASIGICTHAFYEAIHHAAHRELYGMKVTDFPHARALFTDAYARLTAMKLVAQRSSDYMRSASPEDRRYLLYNPVVKMKVTTQGEDVINHLWDVIAAKGFEKDTFFEMAARDIRALPKLEGTVHVNIALILKFMENYFFHPADLPQIPRRDDAADDAFLFAQGPTRGLGKVRFHDPHAVFARFDHPNVAVFREQMAAFETMLATATPTGDQTRDVDFLLAIGEIFTLAVYGQLFLESAEIAGIDDDLIDQVFDVLVRDWSRFAVILHGKPTTGDDQAKHCLAMIRRPAADPGRFERVWASVHGLADAYQMAP